MANLIEKYPVPVILKKIHKEMFTGQLTVTGEGFSKSLHFKEGDPRSVSSTLIRDRLGEILLSSGKLSRSQLDTLTKTRGKADVKFGKLLVQNNILTHRDLYSALQDQMKTIALSMFSLTSGEWSFSNKLSETIEDMKFEMSLPQLLIQGSQHIKSFSYFENRFGKRVPVTREIPEHIGQLLSADEIRFYVNLTKCNNLACNEIVVMMEVPGDVFWQKVVLMYLLDILDFTEIKAGRDSNWAPATDSDVYRTLQHNPIHRSSKVELTDTASACDVVDDYFSYSKKDIPVEEIMEFSAPTPQPKERETEPVHETPAKDTDRHADPAVQMDPADQMEIVNGEEEPPEAIPAEKDSAAKSTSKAHLLYDKAQTLYKERKFFQAVRLLEDAVRLEPGRASYFQLLGLCQLRIPSHRPYAEKHLQKAAQLEPWNADPLYYLGQMYWSEKLPHKAQTYFKKTLDVNPNHAQAKKMLQRLQEKYGKKPLFSFFGKKR
jgi:hypothetical protein